MSALERVGKDWMNAKNVIRDFLSQVCPGHTLEQLDHNAAAIIARLAAHDPPLLIYSSEEES